MGVSIALDAASQQEEVFRLRLSILKKEETELQIQKEKLLIEQNLHIKQLHLIRDEQRSRFKDFPVLNNRYVLTNLIGRGGFSEVYKVSLFPLLLPLPLPLPLLVARK